MVEIPKNISPIVEAIYNSYESRQNDGFRAHLGASIIGDECERKLWYSFRWATKIYHSGRLLRLFQTGNLEENRFVNDLRSIGVTVLDIDPETGKQWTVKSVNGHFGGSADGVGIGFPGAEKTWHLIEMKTHSEKSFNDLVKNGVQKSKPLHYCQMVMYMHFLGLERSVYIAVNKNDDSLHIERIHADEAAALRLIAKAERIIGADNPPERAFKDATFYMCKWCDHADTCWHEAIPQSNCRTCMRSTPVADGAWHCAKYDDTIPLKAQRAGCGFHLHIPAALGGKEQIDVVGDGDGIVYRCADGSEWCDGVPF